MREWGEWERRKKKMGKSGGIGVKKNGKREEWDMLEGGKAESGNLDQNKKSRNLL